MKVGVIHLTYKTQYLWIGLSDLYGICERYKSAKNYNQSPAKRVRSRRVFQKTTLLANIIQDYGGCIKGHGGHSIEYGRWTLDK
jgi:hypothetical protein